MNALSRDLNEEYDYLTSAEAITASPESLGPAREEREGPARKRCQNGPYHEKRKQALGKVNKITSDPNQRLVTRPANGVGNVIHQECDMDLGSSDFFGSSSYDSFGSSQLSDYLPSQYTVYVSGTRTSQPSVTYTPSWEGPQPWTDAYTPAAGTYAANAPLNLNLHLDTSTPSITLATYTPNAVDYFGGFTTAGSVLLSNFAESAGAVTTAMTKFEAQVASHVVNVPGITGAVLSLAQVVGAWQRGDERDVWGNSGNALGGMTAAELTAAAVLALGGGPVSVAAFAGVASVLGGIGGATISLTVHDVLTGKITEQQGDLLIQTVQGALDSFYQQNPSIRNQADR